jgi:RNA polymerase sigma factor (sigma-70 family)
MNDKNLQLYFLEMGKYKVLTPEEELDCAQKIVEHFGLLVEEMLRVPFVWEYIFNRWRRLKATGKASNKLAEEYGNPNHDAEDLTVQVDENIEAAMQLSGHHDRTEYTMYSDSRVAYHLKLAGLSKSIYMDLVDETLAQSDLPEDKRKRICELRDEVVKQRHHLVTANLRLVINFAKKFNGFGISLPDLIQEGNIGLMRAAEKFDPSRNLKFSTYAAWWIRQSFIKALKKQGKTIRFPSHIHDAMSKIRRAHDELYVELSREPSWEELGERTELDTALVERLLSLRAEPVALETPVFSHESRPKFLLDFIEDKAPDPLSAIGTSRRDDAIIQSIKDNLTKSEQRVIILRFGLAGHQPHTLEQIADTLGKSRERVRQVETSGLSKLKEHASHLEEYNE